VRVPRFLRSASLRTRVAIASAAAASAVVAVFTILTSVVLANNDAAQLDRRLDSIIDAEEGSILMLEAGRRFNWPSDE